MAMQAQTVEASKQAAVVLQLDLLLPPAKPRSGDVSADDVDLHLSTIAGKTASIKVSESSRISDLLDAAEAQLGIPAQLQRWLRDDAAMVLEETASVGNSGLRNADAITVIRHTYVPLVALPDKFCLKLTSARCFRIRTQSSSAFSLEYVVRGDVLNQTMEVQTWRKNDHDTILYDSSAKTITETTSHWMAGTREEVTSLECRCPLTEFVSSWKTCSELRPESSELFWKGFGHKMTREDMRLKKDDFPCYRAVPGWFIAPQENCLELKVDIALPSRNYGPIKHIVRLLLDEEGKPLRAALKGWKQGSLHEEIEEYDVEVQAATSSDDMVE